MKHRAAPRIVILGPPAVGKGTQGRRLAEHLGLSYLGTGALLRAEVRKDSSLGREARGFLERGDYLPDAIMHQILAAWLERHHDGWLLDGFPRSVPQAEFLDQELAKSETTLDLAISLDAPVEVLLDRIRGRVECPKCGWSGQVSQLVGDGNCPKCGTTADAREDDDRVRFLARYQEFTAHVLPVIARYQALGILISIDATAPQDEVASRISDALVTRIQSA